jgi:hypothetical protein
LVYLLVLWIPNSYTILFWEFYFLPFSVHVQTNVSYVAILSLFQCHPYAFILSTGQIYSSEPRSSLRPTQLLVP